MQVNGVKVDGGGGEGGGGEIVATEANFLDQLRSLRNN